MPDVDERRDEIRGGDSPVADDLCGSSKETDASGNERRRVGSNPTDPTTQFASHESASGANTAYLSVSRLLGRK